MTPTPEDARTLVDEWGKGSPDALQLARMVSLASRVEPELLRQARLKLLPQVNAGAEADLWFSPLVQSATPLAFTFKPAIADLLRRELANSLDTLEGAWEVLEEVHRNAPAAIKLEERVTWRILENKKDARKTVETELMSVVSAIVTQNRTGLARWALRAVPRLPEEARKTKAAQTLVLTAAAHLGAWHLLEKQVESNTLSKAFINDLKVVLPSNLPQVRVGVRLLDESDEFRLDDEDRSYVVEFSNPPASDESDLIRVPGTVPLLLEVSWSEGGEQQVRNLSLYHGRVETIKTGASAVTIRTAAGDVYKLSEDKEKEAEAGIDPRSAALARIPSPPSIGYIARRDPTSGIDIVDQIREELEVHRMRALTSRRIARLVRILGSGGVGKTTVAAEVARRELDTYEQRVVWLSAEGRSDFNINSILDGIATQLGHSDFRRLDASAKSREVRSLLSTQEALIFVDDFEIIPSKEQFRCLKVLKSLNVATVIISRQLSPRRAEEFVVLVDSMSTDESREFLEPMARQLEPVLRNVPIPYREIAELCDGNPLAMQLLIAQIAFTQNVGAFSKFEKYKGSALDRVFDLSFNLSELGNYGRGALLGLSLFVPSASREALAEVAGFGQNLSHLNDVAKRLTTLKLACEVSDGKRLGVDGFVRSSVQARVPRSTLSGFAKRFVEYFLTYSEQHSEGTVTHYEALDAEFENLLDAMDLGEELQSWNEVIRICMALSDFLNVRGYWDECLRRNDQAKKAARAARRQDMLPYLNQIAGEIYLRRGEFSKAEVAFRAILRSYANKPLNEDVASATRRLGSVAFEQGNLKLAESFYSEALAICRQLKLENGVADNLHNLAIVAQLQGRLNPALRLYEESLKISERLGDQRSIAISLHQLGVIAREQKRYLDARNFFEQSLNTKRQLGDRNGMADTLHQLGLLLRTLGELEQAERVLRQALTIYDQLQSPTADEVRQDLNQRAVTKKKRRTIKAIATLPLRKKGGGDLKAKSGTARKKPSTKKSAGKSVAAKRRRRIGGFGGGWGGRAGRGAKRRFGGRSGTVLR